MIHGNSKQGGSVRNEGRLLASLRKEAWRVVHFAKWEIEVQGNFKGTPKLGLDYSAIDVRRVELMYLHRYRRCRCMLVGLECVYRA